MFLQQRSSFLHSENLGEDNLLSCQCHRSLQERLAETWCFKEAWQTACCDAVRMPGLLFENSPKLGLCTERIFKDRRQAVLICLPSFAA